MLDVAYFKGIRIRIVILMNRDSKFFQNLTINKKNLFWEKVFFKTLI